MLPNFSFRNYAEVLSSATCLKLIGKAIAYGALVALLTAALAYPLAWFVATRVRVYKVALLTVVLIPLHTGDLIRIFAWRVVLGAEGVLNSFLQWLGITSEPLWFLLFSPFATTIVLTYNYFPFMVLALWAALETLDRSYVEAAFDLGASRSATFLRVVLPLSSPGLLAGFLMVMVLVAGDYLTPRLVGGSSGVTITSAVHDTLRRGLRLAARLCAVVESAHRSEHPRRARGPFVQPHESRQVDENAESVVAGRGIERLRSWYPPRAESATTSRSSPAVRTSRRGRTSCCNPCWPGRLDERTMIGRSQVQ